ncbi:hypothetical protein [Confluentibacter sediminis]|uniref:hypothetical protein n=1 Tax=Confluentibacter sediminis TaxID=2219045 RepID=UPI000DABC895|nr:hypothetical protein [Confluentibacter sediminis]
MKKLVFLFLLIIISLISCDGRKNKGEALKLSVEKFKDTLEPIEITKYIPEVYSEIETDSILSNGFSIHLKTYANMNESVSKKYKVDTITHIDIHRDWISEVKIKKDNVLIFNEIIDKDFFIKHAKNIDKNLSESINTRIWIDEETSIEKDYINLFAGYTYPNNNESVIFKLKVDNQGHYLIEKLNSERTI